MATLTHNHQERAKIERAKERNRQKALDYIASVKAFTPKNTIIGWIVTNCDMKTRAARALYATAK